MPLITPDLRLMVVASDTGGTRDMTHATTLRGFPKKEIIPAAGQGYDRRHGEALGTNPHASTDGLRFDLFDTTFRQG